VHSNYRQTGQLGILFKKRCSRMRRSVWKSRSKLVAHAPVVHKWTVHVAARPRAPYRRCLKLLPVNY